MEINFYQLTDELKKSLPILSVKMLEQKKKVLIFSESSEKIAEIDRFLWTQGKIRFIPHGTKQDGDYEKQPIFLSTEPENLNNAEFVIILDNIDNDFLNTFSKAFYMFENKDEEAKKLARQKWKGYKELNHNLNYFKQEKDGKWTKQEI